MEKIWRRERKLVRAITNPDLEELQKFDHLGKRLHFYNRDTPLHIAVRRFEKKLYAKRNLLTSIALQNCDPLMEMILFLAEQTNLKLRDKCGKIPFEIMFNHISVDYLHNNKVKAVFRSVFPRNIKCERNYLFLIAILCSHWEYAESHVSKNPNLRHRILN